MTGTQCAVIRVFFVLLTFQIVFAQGSPSISKVDALKGSANPAGWKEVVSDSGRFRASFPCEPQTNNDVISVPEWKCDVARLAWLVSYSDLPSESSGDGLRLLYSEAINAMLTDNTQLVTAQDFSLNGRMGKYIVLKNPSYLIYMRTFVVGRRLYIVSVTAKGGEASTDESSRIQKFFESFVYWNRS